MSTQTYDSIIECAKISEQIERYSDMLEEMTQFVRSSYEAKRPLSREERKLLFVAYKNVIGANRSALRILQELAVSDPDNAYVPQKTDLVAKEFVGSIDNGLAFADLYLLNPEGNYIANDEAMNDLIKENAICYLKWKGDLFRWRAEALAGAERETAVSNASASYEKATVLSEKLKATDPVRLGLILNYSTHCYEVLGDATRAIAMAKKGFDDAIAELDNLEEDSYKDSTEIMQLLRDNLTLWTSEADANAEPV
ncbi:MAG: 14-3-3 family protein [Gammaproteobacteria bacterium]